MIEKTCTWIEAKEVATNRLPNDHKEGSIKFSKGFSWDNNKGRKKNRDMLSPYKGFNHRLLENLVRSPREILETKEAAKDFEQPPRMLANLVKGIKKDKKKAFDTQMGEWNKGDKDVAFVEAPILMISREDHTMKRKFTEEAVNGIREITFPHVLGSKNSHNPVIIRV
ncbi:hypothetical protein Tco_1566617 [Tanacetum coccineum]